MIRPSGNSVPLMIFAAEGLSMANVAALVTAAPIPMAKPDRIPSKSSFNVVAPAFFSPIPT